MINFLNLWNISGNEYHKYSLSFSQYIKTNKELVKLINFQEGQIIIDLACGTGLTTLEILKQNSDIKKIYAIDFSNNMLDIAKKMIKSKKVEFICSDVKNIDKFINEKADIIVCNSAFWQFDDKNLIINKIHSLLKNGGKFIFNLNQQFFDFGYEENYQKILIDEIFNEIKSKGYNITSGLLKNKLKIDEIKDIFKKQGFILIDHKIINFGKKTLKEFIEFFKIPATATFFENIPKKEQNIILKNVYNKLKNKFEINNNQWIYFIFSK